MKTYIPLFLLIVAVQQTSATTFYDQLYEFNFNWQKYEAQAPEGSARQFASEREYVQAHLSSVLPILRTNPVDHLNIEQLNSRLHLIEILDAYRIAGNFPINYYRQERIPVFIDEHNTHCAVGYLLQHTGYEDVARRIAGTDNYAWVKDIKDQALLEWQEFSGFTLEELKLIQGAYDYYMPDARFLPNKYEIPQKPECLIIYFDSKPETPQNIWCYGEGENGVLNGRWEQNYAAGIPWIEGYFENGNRTGQWKEYYQGTNQLCRTENWRNDKLNGVRKRFDREGVLIEEILFKDGVAITKTNYDHTTSMRYVRTPLDSNLVRTEVFTFGGGLLAYGHERIHNPGNLQWFQNIELTALNSAAIASRDASQSNGLTLGNGANFTPFGGSNLYNTPPLVQYKKEGEWVYYREYGTPVAVRTLKPVQEMLHRDYPHFAASLFQEIHVFEGLAVDSGYDSIRIEYIDNKIQNFYGTGKEHTHWRVSYHDVDSSLIPYGPNRWVPIRFQPLKEIGQYNQEGLKIGTWKHFDRHGTLYKTENYLIPWKAEAEKAVAGEHAMATNTGR